jgi:hypothetical protein
MEPDDGLERLKEQKSHQEIYSNHKYNQNNNFQNLMKLI